MTEGQAQKFVDSAIQAVRVGSFTTVYQDNRRMRILANLARRPDLLGVQSTAILAEIYDQVGKYKDAGLLVNIDVAKREIRALREEINLQRARRSAVRAHSWLILQCAISQFRREGAQAQALNLIDEALEMIGADRGTVMNSQHIQSLFHFWRGRINTARYNFREADIDFQTALRVADETLREKLQLAERTATEQDRERVRFIHIQAGNYVMATCLSFGLGQSRQWEGRLFDSLWFLRAAVPLSRSSSDFHRRGFAHLLAGTVLRGIAQRGTKDFDAADEELSEARALLGHSERPHQLHLARVYHQLALSKYNRVPLEGAKSDADRESLGDALQLNEYSARLSGDADYEGYRDPMLEYGIKVARSLIETAMGNYSKAYECALEALDSNAGTLPKGTRGSALIARAMARADRVHETGQQAEISDAETAFAAVLKEPALRATDRAVAHLQLSRLYSRIGQPFRAAVHYDRALPLVEASEHGWVKDLQRTAKLALTTFPGPELTVDVKELTEAAKAKNLDPWSYITRYIDVDLKRRLLMLNQSTLQERDGEAKLAKELGLTRATIFNWKKDPDLRGLFPTRR